MLKRMTRGAIALLLVLTVGLGPATAATTELGNAVEMGNAVELNNAVELGPFAFTPSLQWLFNGLDTSGMTFGGGGQTVADYQGNLVTVPSGVPAIEGARLATTVAEGAELGPELVTNGGFDTDLSGWNTDSGRWYWDNGTATVDGTLPRNLVQTILEIGKKYQLAYEVTDEGNAGANLALWSSDPNVALPSSHGKHTYTFGASQTDLQIRGDDGVHLDNVSVREVIPTWYTPDTFFTTQIKTKSGTVTRITEDPDWGGYLGEGARTNLLTYSEDAPSIYSNALTVTSDNAVAPDGNTTADTVTATDISAYLRDGAVAVSESTTYAFSWWAGNLTGGTVKYRIYDVSNASEIGSAEYTPDGSRQSVAFTTPAGCTSIYVYSVYNLTVGESVWTWGRMLEQASFPSSYIKTENATVTRSATVASHATDGVLRGNNLAIRGIVTPLAGGQNEPFFSTTNGTDWFQIRAGAIQLVLTKYVGGSFYEEKPLYTHSADTPFEYRAYISDQGMGIQVREWGDGNWGAWSPWGTDLDTHDIPVGSTFEIGSRNGSNHFFGKYGEVATLFLKPMSSPAEVQEFVEDESNWEFSNQASALIPADEGIHYAKQPAPVIPLRREYWSRVGEWKEAA